MSKRTSDYTPSDSEDDIYELELVKTPNKGKLSKTSVGNITKSNPSVPGRAPKVADHLLSAGELEKRNRRRQCNREAANRQRERRLKKVENLQNEVPLSFHKY